MRYEQTKIQNNWLRRLLHPKTGQRDLYKLIYNLFEVKPTWYQLKTLQDMLNPSISNMVISFSRQSGKTETIAMALALYPIVFNNINIYVFGPKEEQAGYSFSRAGGIIHHNKWNLYSGNILVDKATQLEFSNKVTIGAKSASLNAEIEGLTGNIIILDEIQNISSYKIKECIAEGTEVPIPDGSFMEISRLIRNQCNVITPKGVCKPIRYIEAGPSEIFEIVLDNGRSIEVTENHRHLVYSKNWRNNKAGATKILQTKELKVGLRLAEPEILPYFGKQGTFEEGLLLGALLGDGSFVKSSPSFCGSKPFIDIINKIVKKMFQINATLKCKDKEKNFYHYNYTQPRKHRFCNKMSDWLKDLEVWGSTFDKKHVPNRDWSEEFLRGLIIGLIETDGCVGTKKGSTISFGNTSLQLVKRLQDYLLKFGIHGVLEEDIRPVQYRRFYGFYIKGVEDIKKFCYKFKLYNKQKKLESLFQTVKNKKGRIDSKYYPKDMRFVRIKAIIKKGIKNAYCVEVSGNLWVVNNLITGNSILPMGAAVDAKLVFVGVPKTRGTFWHDCWRNDRYTTHIYDWKKCLRPYGLLYKDYVLDRMSEDPEIFATQFELKWNEDLSTMFLQDTLEACEQDYYLEEDRGNIWGIDFAKKRDSTVITEYLYTPESNSGKVVNWYELKGTKYTDQIGYMKDIKPPNLEIAYCDKSSIGEPVIEFMMENGIPAQGLVFNLHTKDKMYKFLRNQINQKRVHWPRKENCKKTRRQFGLYKNFMQQMLDLEVEYKTSGLISVHHPLDISNAKDDFPDSLALAVFGSQEYVAPNAGFWD